MKVMRELSKLDPGFAASTSRQHLVGVFENLTRSLRSTYDLILKDEARDTEEGALRTRANRAESRVNVLEREAAEEKKKFAEEREKLVAEKAKMAAEHAQVVLHYEEKVQRLEAEKLSAGDEALAAYKFTNKFYSDAAPLIACCNRDAYKGALKHIQTLHPEMVVTGLHYRCSRIAVACGSGTRCPSDVSLEEPEPIDGPFGEVEGRGDSGETSPAVVPEESVAPAEGAASPATEV